MQFLPPQLGNLKNNMTNAFSIKESIVFGWHKVKAHSGIVFGVVLTMFALQVASSVVQKTLNNTATGMAASLVLSVAGVVLGAGMTLIFLKLAKGEPAHYREIVPPVGLVWKYFCVSFITSIIAILPVMAGGLLALALLVSAGAVNFSEGASAPIAGSFGSIALAILIVAVAIGCALYLALRYSMARLAVLDGAGITESLNKSTALTRGVKWQLVLFALALVALNIVGAIALLVGLLVTVPISLLAYTHVYLKLEERQGSH